MKIKKEDVLLEIVCFCPVIGMLFWLHCSYVFTLLRIHGNGHFRWEDPSFVRKRKDALSGKKQENTQVKLKNNCIIDKGGWELNLNLKEPLNWNPRGTTPYSTTTKSSWMKGGGRVSCTKLELEVCIKGVKKAL